MEKEKLTLLQSELKAQQGDIGKIYQKLDDRQKEEGKGRLESIGYQLHNLYCAFEDLFKIVASFFENSIQDKTHYHYELLKRMTVQIEGVRPALLSREAFLLLDNLRSFRHFFRHAYSYELDERKLLIVLEDALKLRKIYPQEIDFFLKRLKTK